MYSLNFLKKNIFKHKVVLITGGSGQLGRSMCKFYLDLGCKVYSIDTNKLSLKNSKLNQFYIDISKKNDCKKVLNKIFKKEKKIDILINNAGKSVFTHYTKRTDDELDGVYNANLKGIINMINIISNQKNKKSFLNIVNISSIYGVIVPDFSIYKKGDRFNSEIYGATKAGIIQLTKYYAKILSKKNILCNCISPGGIKSNKTQTNNFQQRYIKKLQVKRMAKSEDIIFALYYLTNPFNNYVTGQNLIVDGGYTL